MRAAERAGPIGDRELGALFAPLAAAPRIALAVSGGVDSLALLDCIDRWRRKLTRPPDVVVFTVDHGLRKSSAKEAKAVVAAARERGIKAEILRWTGKKPRGDVEAAARAARYRLLLLAASEARASHLLLAHHRDDQAETLLLRLARGSGLFGLAAMRREIKGAELTILRPFLDVARSRLEKTIAIAGLTPVEDAMNSDPRYARARFRRIMPLLAADGIDAAGLAATAQRLAAAAESIDASATRVIERAVATDELATAAIDPTVFLAIPSEIRLRTFNRILLAVGGETYPPRYDRLAPVLAAMEEHDGRTRLKRTLAGAVIEWRQGRFVVYREIGRAGLPEIRVKPGFAGIWDHRFVVEVGPKAPRGLRVAALGEAGRQAIGARASGSAAAGALASLPALWRNGRVEAVPTLAYRAKGGSEVPVSVRSILAERLLEPPRFPDFLGPK